MYVYNLADKPEYFDTVVDLLFNEWGTHEGKGNRVYWESWIRSSLSKTDVPQTYVAIENEVLLATFSLWRCDLQSRQDLFPWFGGLYVNPQYRHTGIGKMMQSQALSILKQLGYKEVYLFSELSGYYESTGWVYQGLIPNEQGEMVRLYKYLIL